MKQQNHHDMLPRDSWNQELLSHVAPSDWVSPEPEKCYNLVVLGAGTGGLVSALGCAALGGKVALVERALMVGDCLNTGCVPSKSLLRSARAAAEMRHAERFGLTPAEVGPQDFPRVMERLRRIRSSIAVHDAAQRYADLGVHVFLGEAVFESPSSVLVGDRRLRFKKAIIATGARAVHLNIPGLEGDFFTNETIFQLTELPPRLVVIGGGPIGCELSQAFRRLGSEVTIIQKGRFLPREDPEASALLASVFEREGLRVLLDSEPLRVEKTEKGHRVFVQTPEGEEVVTGDAILMGAGRQPNVEGLALEKAGVTYHPRRGVEVDSFLRTSNRNIFAVGDVCMQWKFTHAADAAARIALQNALFGGRKKLEDLLMPWCTYTDPEIAHVGLYERDAAEAGIPVTTFKVDLREVDRAVTDGEEEGFVKILVKEGTDTILGATVVGSHAGEMLSEITLAMKGKIGLKKLNEVIHPYPTQAEALRRIAGKWQATRLTPGVAKLLKGWLAWQRR
jgi:pyruvate/2-oxoglutarate dehydrogenase complex dihydrolipoamide dehydrogenase (E3) component